MTLTERETVRRTGILIGKSFPDLARPFIETCLKHGATRDNRIVIQNTLRNADVETRGWIANKYVDEWLELFAGGDGFTDVAKTKSLDYFHHSKDAFGVIQTLPDSEQRKIAEKLLKDLHVFVRVEGIEGCLTTFSEAEREQILTDALSHERRSLKMIKMILPRLPMDRRIRMARKTVVDRWGYSAIVTLHAIADAPQDVRIEIAGKAADRLTLTREVAAVLHDLTDEQLDDFKSRHTRPISKRNFNSRKPIKTIGAAVVERVKADRLK